MYIYRPPFQAAAAFETTQTDVSQGRSWRVKEKENAHCSVFTIRIMRRDNANWQGEIIWTDGGRRQYFRSVYEMTVLMKSALDTFKKQ